MHPPFVVLDFPPAPGRAAGSQVFVRPLLVVSATSLDQVEPALRRVDEEVGRGRHALGFVAYEAAPAFDAAMAVPPAGPLPLAWFAIFDAPRPPARPGGSDPDDRLVVAWRERPSAIPHGDAVEAIRTAIGRGDVYQVNHTVRLDVEVRGDPGALYRRMIARQGGGYGARLHTGRFEILSASPELFFRRDGGRITAQPMKGTARRGRWLEEDDARAAALAASAKERAENVMIVDLIRNDLSRVAVAGTVAAPRLFEVHRLPTVLQMTSTVTAEARPGVSTWDLFAALFPCGSVTGAPKIAATRAIAALEPDPRGVYCGAIAHLAPDGTATFSVAIRTLTIDHGTGRAEYGAGSGITWDSAGAAEYDELRAKAAILTDDLPRLDLIETMRLDEGRYARLPFHLDRLRSSAAYFGFADPDGLGAAAARALAEHARASPGPARVRLVASPDARVRLEASPLEPAPASPPVVVLASSPVRRQNRFLCHKTSHRAVYEQHRSQHPGAFDVLLWNEDEEVTEFTIGNVVVEIDGARWTPPRDCGLLAGAMRAELLATGTITERVITRADLARATRLWLINSVREEIEVRMEAGIGPRGTVGRPFRAGGSRRG
jgi:para-aminobenzoate synthetase/4-amino-4-deoxychorismate lyase